MNPKNGPLVLFDATSPGSWVAVGVLVTLWVLSLAWVDLSPGEGTEKALATVVGAGIFCGAFVLTLIACVVATLLYLLTRACREH